MTAVIFGSGRRWGSCGMSVTVPGASVSPVHPIGAEVLPGKITLKGGAVFAPSQTRPEGAPLTVILRGKRMPGTEDGPGPFL